MRKDLGARIGFVPIRAEEAESSLDGIECSEQSDAVPAAPLLTRVIHWGRLNENG